MNDVRLELCNLWDDPRAECQWQRNLSIQWTWKAGKDEKTVVSINRTQQQIMWFDRNDHRTPNLPLWIDHRIIRQIHTAGTLIQKVIWLQCFLPQVVLESIISLNYEKKNLLMPKTLKHVVFLTSNSWFIQAFKVFFFNAALSRWHLFISEDKTMAVFIFRISFSQWN